MPLMKIQGEAEKRQKIYYQVNSSDAPIGVGGMGQVYKGMRVDERTGSTRPVAIKFMYADLPAHAIERARREASIQLRNDNLVEMLGFIEIEERTVTGEVAKHYHVVSELLTGVSLSDVLEGKTKDRDGNEVPFAVKMSQDFRNDPEHFARTVVINVLSGLMALHDAGYIHRDIDPSNIMLTADEHIKLIDFGIAKQMKNLTTNDKGLTVAGSFMGKPEYAAPELALGDVKSQNQTTDIYAVGILLYQCIVGHTPFEGARHEILEKQLKAKLPLGVIKDRALRAIIAKACEKKQDLRYQSSAQMRVALENPEKPSLLSGGSMVKYAIAAVLAAVVLLLGGMSLISPPDPPEIVDPIIIQKIDSLINVAKQKAQAGQNRELDDYEQLLMEAYEKYEEAQMMAATVDEADIANSITNKLYDIYAQLENAKEDFQSKARAMSEYGEYELAEQYSRRASALDRFLSEHISLVEATEDEVIDSLSMDSVAVDW